MAEKEAFFNLEPATQNRIRIFMAIISVSNCLVALYIPYTNILCPLIGIAINLILVFYAIFISRAPGLYFRLITLVFWFAIIGSVFGILLALWNQEPFGIQYAQYLFTLALVGLFAKPVMRYRRSIREIKEE